MLRGGAFVAPSGIKMLIAGDSELALFLLLPTYPFSRSTQKKASVGQQKLTSPCLAAALHCTCHLKYRCAGVHTSVFLVTYLNRLMERAFLTLGNQEIPSHKPHCSGRKANGDKGVTMIVIYVGVFVVLTFAF